MDADDRIIVAAGLFLGEKRDTKDERLQKYPGLETVR